MGAARGVAVDTERRRGRTSAQHSNESPMPGFQLPAVKWGF